LNTKAEVIKRLCDAIQLCATHLKEELGENAEYNPWQEVALIKELADALYGIRDSCG